MSKAVSENDTKKFCLLISDGAPNEEIDETKSAVMKQFCDANNIVGTCYKEERDWDTGKLVKKPQSCCNTRNVMYRIKSMGYIVFGIYVQEASISGQMFAAANEARMKLFASCEKTGTYGFTNEYNPADFFNTKTTEVNGTRVTHAGNYDADGGCLYRRRRRHRHRHHHRHHCRHRCHHHHHQPRILPIPTLLRSCALAHLFVGWHRCLVPSSLTCSEFLTEPQASNSQHG